MITKLKDIPNINNGGCGIAALVIHRQLKAVGLDTEILFMYGKGEDSEFLKNLNLGANGDSLYAPEHVGILLGNGRILDALGVVPEDAFDDWHSVSEKELIDCINSPEVGMWNSDFKRVVLKDYPDILGLIPDVIL